MAITASSTFGTLVKPGAITTISVAASNSGLATTRSHHACR